MQIWPRIRVGGTVGKIGQNVKNQAIRQLHQTGKILDNKYVKGAVAAGLTATGVGAPLAAAILASEAAAGKGLKKGGTLKSAAAGAVQGAVQGGGGALLGKLGGVLPKIPGGGAITALGSKLSQIPGAGVVGGLIKDQLHIPTGTPTAPASDEPPVVIGYHPDGSPIYNTPSPTDAGRYHPITPGAPKPSGGWMDSVGGFLSKHKDDILDYGSAAEQIADRVRRNKLQDEGLALARGNYNANAGLRDAGRAGLLDNSRPDVSSIFADPTNPAGRYRRVSVGSRA